MSRAIRATQFGRTGGEGIGVREHLREQLRQRNAESMEHAYRSMAEYAELVPEPQFGQLDFVQFPYQIEPLYSDAVADAREVVLMKATQVGVTTALWRWAVRRADQFGDTVIYFFPTSDHVTEFGTQKIEPAIEASPYLIRRMAASSVRNKKQKAIGAGWLNLRGVASKRAVQSVDADALVFDEYDDSDPTNIGHAERRLSGAMAAGRTPRLRRIGRPSVPGYGIDAEYQGSDQRIWLVTCPSCELEQPVGFENLRWTSVASEGDTLRPGSDLYVSKKDVASAWRVCSRCEHTLEPPEGSDVGPIHHGRWEAQAPQQGRVIGYHIPRLIVPRTDLAEIVADSRGTKISEVELFHWADLGMAYAPADAMLTDEQIDRVCGLGGEPLEEYRGRFVTTMGVDAAGERDLTVRASELAPDGTRRAIYLGEPKDFEEVEGLINRLRIGVVAIDSNPERRNARALQKKFPGRVFLVDYDEKPEADPVRYSKEKDLYHVNRTEALDAMMDTIRHGTNLPLRQPPPKYREQLKAPKRRWVVNSAGKARRVYVSTGTMGDDYAHAEVFDLVAETLSEMLGMVAKQLADDGRELSPEELGFTPVKLA